MNKLLYIIMFAVLALTSCSEDGILAEGQYTDGRYTFKVGIEEPDYATQSRASVTMGRYLLEMYEGNLAAVPVKMKNTDGVFNVQLKKGVDYVCLFWADNGTDYDATSLKAVKQADETTMGKEAYCAKITVNSKTFDGAVTLQHAVAELSFIDKNGLTNPTSTLLITYPYASAALNVGDGMVTYVAGEAKRTIGNIAPPTDKTQAFATDYILAPTAGGKLAGLKFMLNTDAEKTVAEAAVKANYKTKITGEYEQPMPSMRFTIDTRNNTDNSYDNTFILPLAGLCNYSLTVDWGDDNKQVFAAGTTLNQTNMTHSYPAPGKYTITIYSSQKNVLNQQMPEMNFYTNYRSVNNNPLKLISLDSPLLNMGYELAYCFSGCSGLTGEIPADLFVNNPDVLGFYSCFKGCSGLTGEIPAELFANNPNVYGFDLCFSGCSGLTGEIPAELFANNPKVDSFDYCFYGCSGLTGEIPAELFANNPNLVRVYSCFEGCSGLTGEIPAELFANNPNLASVNSFFYGCSGLTGEIPAKLFANNPNVGGFGSFFEGCSGLTGEIPAELFANNPKATSFYSCFKDCSDLTGKIPADLFANNPKVEGFTCCFDGCSGLTGEIPAGLFANNLEVVDFTGCFYNCSGLTGEIPEELFVNNTAATNFSSCFGNCVKLKLNANIFCIESTETKAKRFEGQEMSFLYCFSNCGSDTSIVTGDGGTAPALWSYTMKKVQSSGCFRGVTKVTNVGNIATGWK